MITVGVDLAADPKRTAVAVIEWTGRDARVVEVVPMANDPEIVRLATRAEKTGIDCPLGWPDDFVTFVNAHHRGRVPHTDVGPEIREPLRFRETDRRLAAANLGRPLSVSSDMIGVCAMRAAGLLAAMAQEGIHVDRSGVTGRVVETYPAVAIKQWHLAQGGNPSERRYKGTAQSAVLGAMVDELKRGLRQLKLGQYEDSCRSSDHVFDAVICAMVARATMQFQCTQQIPRGLVQRARREGWIAVPTCRLEDLLASPTFSPSAR